MAGFSRTFSATGLGLFQSSAASGPRLSEASYFCAYTRHLCSPVMTPAGPPETSVDAAPGTGLKKTIAESGKEILQRRLQGYLVTISAVGLIVAQVRRQVHETIDTQLWRGCVRQIDAKRFL